jgi:hypothetical protein
MQQNVQISVEGQVMPLDVDIASKRWSAKDVPGEGCFPLVMDLNGKRYELYSDGTLGEVEM